MNDLFKTYQVCTGRWISFSFSPTEYLNSFDTQEEAVNYVETLAGKNIKWTLNKGNTIHQLVANEKFGKCDFFIQSKSSGWPNIGDEIEIPNISIGSLRLKDKITGKVVGIKQKQDSVYGTACVKFLAEVSLFGTVFIHSFTPECHWSGPNADFK